MQVEMKVVPTVHVRDGTFSNGKTFHQLQWTIKLTDAEKALIEEAGLRDFTTYETEQHNDDHTYSAKKEFPISPWVDENVDYGCCEFDTLIEAQAAGQELKANLVRLKEAMNQHTHIGTNTEYSFEL